MLCIENHSSSKREIFEFIINLYLITTTTFRQFANKFVWILSQTLFTPRSSKYISRRMDSTKLNDIQLKFNSDNPYKMIMCPQYKYTS